MTLKEYAKYINDLAQKYPDLPVVYSRDDEGNWFQKIHYQPSVGFLDADGNFIALEEAPNEKPNAVCVN